MGEAGFTASFKFRIGDLVYFRDASNDEHRRPTRHQIHTRVAEECIGGVQLFYRLVGQQSLVPELALTKERPPFDDSYVRERFKAERAARDEYIGNVGVCFEHHK